MKGGRSNHDSAYSEVFMAGARLDDVQSPQHNSFSPIGSGEKAPARPAGETAAPVETTEFARATRRTPRRSFIVVVPDSETVDTAQIAERLRIAGDEGVVDVIVACAGQRANLSTLADRIRDVQVLVAPAGTTQVALRELAVSRARGDIVTLVGSATFVKPPADF
jgi:hypothetical protein